MQKYMVTFIKCLLLLGACTPINVQGETRTTPYIADFAARQVFSMVRYDTPNCKDYKVANTVFKDSRQVSTGVVWNEEWIIDACGTHWLVPIEFYTVEGDPNNTTVSVDTNLIKQIQ